MNKRVAEVEKTMPRQKRKYRCRQRSPATIERSKRQRRDKANARERRRMNSLNDALEELRKILPHSMDEPKMTKIETLRFAQLYIDMLDRTLKNEEPQPQPPDIMYSPHYQRTPYFYS